MTDLYLAHHAPLELFRGVTRRISVKLYAKALGGDTVAGVPTAPLSIGAAKDWSDYPIVVAAIAPAVPVYVEGVLQNAQLRAEWFTSNPADVTVIIEADTLEDAIALAPTENPALVWSIIARRETAGVIDDEVVLVNGPVYVTDTAVYPGMPPLA
jgi:hypothetical protein